MYRKTGGNPFFVTEVLAAGGDTLPATVQDAVLARVARLEPAGRRLVEAVAIFPTGVDVIVLEAIEDEVATGVEQCLASGVLAPIAGGVAFRHELARLAVEVSLSPARRVSLNRAALMALSDPTRGPIDPTSLSHHAEAAADVEAVLRFAPQAAAIAAQAQAHREAAAQYARALRFGWALSDEQRAELLSLRSWECFVVGHYSEAIETRREALAAYRLLGDRMREGDALRAMSSNLRCYGRVAEATETGLAAVTVLETLPPGHELALAYANRAMLALNVEDTTGTREWGRKAQELAEGIDDRETLVHAMNSIGTAGYLLGDHDGRRALERSCTSARSGDYSSRQVAPTSIWRGRGFGCMTTRVPRPINEKVSSTVSSAALTRGDSRSSHTGLASSSTTAGGMTRPKWRRRFSDPAPPTRSHKR